MLYQKGSLGLFFKGDPSLVGYWPLQENSVDYSEHGLNGTDTSMSYNQPGFKNDIRSAYFNGSSWITASGSSINFNQTQPFSISFWIKTPTIASREYHFINKEENSANEWFVLMGIGKNHNKLGFAVGKKNVDMVGMTDPTPVIPNTWHHYVSVWTGNVGGTNNLLLYRNGILVAIGSYSTTGATQSLAPLWIGRSYKTTDYTYIGNMSELGIFNRALSPQEISQYHQWATSISKKDSLIGLIEEGTASTITALLSTLEAQKKDTVATLSDLQAEKKSPVAIQSTFEQEIKSTASLQSTLEKALKATASLYSLLEKYQVNTTALSSLLEKQGKSPVAFTSLLEKSQSVTTAIQTLLETLKKSNVALTSQLEGQLKSTTALWTELERILSGADTVALYSLLEKLTYATVSFQSTLEKAIENTVALSSELEAKQFSTTPLLSVLRPFKVIHPLHNADKHSGLLHNADKHTSKIHNIKKL